VPILSVGYLAFVPFLWLALIRRRAEDWVVCAAYLAAALFLMYVTVVNFHNSAAWAAGYVLMACLALIAAAHTVVEFRPAAGAATWGEARPVSDSGGRQPENRDDTPADTVHHDFRR